MNNIKIVGYRVKPLPGFAEKRDDCARQVWAYSNTRTTFIFPSQMMEKLRVVFGISGHLCPFCGRPIRQKNYSFCCRGCKYSYYDAYLWTWFISVVRSRYNGKCAICGVQDDGNIIFEYHHIIPIALGGAPLDMDNVIPLCKNCHLNIHRGDGLKHEKKNRKQSRLDYYFLDINIKKNDGPGDDFNAKKI